MEDDWSPYPIRLRLLASECVCELSEHIEKESLGYVHVYAITMMHATLILISYSTIQNKACTNP